MSDRKKKRRRGEKDLPKKVETAATVVLDVDPLQWGTWRK